MFKLLSLEENSIVYQIKQFSTILPIIFWDKSSEKCLYINKASGFDHSLSTTASALRNIFIHTSNSSGNFKLCSASSRQRRSHEL